MTHRHKTSTPTKAILMSEKLPNTVFVPLPCKQCDKKVEPVSNGDVNPTHGYKLFCPECNTFIGWGGKAHPVKNGNGERERSSQWSAKRLGFNYCQTCLRKKEHLGIGRLEVHHVTPIEDDGKDLPGNIQILCTSCHREVHHRRTYLNDHLKPYYKAGGAADA